MKRLAYGVAITVLLCLVALAGFAGGTLAAAKALGVILVLAAMTFLVVGPADFGAHGARVAQVVPVAQAPQQQRRPVTPRTR